MVKVSQIKTPITPVGRFFPAKMPNGNWAEDIADAAVFLAKHTYITGQVLHVDGGMCM